MDPPGDAEWLLVDGAGGYACGSADDLARRRYHAWWVVARADGRRMLSVAGCDERLLRDGVVHHLLHAHWRDQPAPSRPAAQVAFAHRPLPACTFRIGALCVERTVALRRVAAEGPPALLVRWRNRSPVAVRLDVRPLLGFHDADHLVVGRDDGDGTVHARGASWGFRPNDALPVLWLTADAVAAFRGEPAWYRGFVFATDRERGYDHVGDRWTPGVLELDLGPGGEATVAFTHGEPCPGPAAAFEAVAASADAAWLAAARDPDPLRARLSLSAGDFLYRTANGRPGVLAGFPWFSEWGRDTFVSLPGLTLARGRPDLCAEVLRAALPFLRGGLLPNVYGADPASSHYDSCDAALWFALAVQRFADAGGDPELVRDELVPALAGIAAAYEAGTALGVRAEPSGLLAAGGVDLNATWMDARIGAVPVTPRQGFAVELQALWHSLLVFLAERDADGERGRHWRALAERCGRALVRDFWLADGEYLADRVHAGRPDRAVRPNMLVAAALARSPLAMEQRAGVVRKARAELVTPVGLRTLSPLDPAYQPRYGGGGAERDRAYHQGTVWPWLAGFYVEAALAAVPKKGRAREAKLLRAWLDGFLPELDRAGLDHVSEVFDGDPPHRPGGTVAQAWNSGELLRALALCGQGSP